MGHEWKTSVVSRTSASHGCPYCAGVTVWSGYNDLATLRPDIAADWDYELNDKLPSEVMPYSQKKHGGSAATGIAMGGTETVNPLMSPEKLEIEIQRLTDQQEN